MLLTVEEGITGRMCHSINCYTKASKKYMKECDTNRESSYSQFRDVNNLYV